jgi:hypothetical protein
MKNSYKIYNATSIEKVLSHFMGDLILFVVAKETYVQRGQFVLFFCVN